MIILGLPFAEFVSVAANIFTPLVVGLIIWFLGEYAINKRIRSETIRELMTYRGSFSTEEFRRALNKVSVTFHNDNTVRKEVRELYDAMKNPANQEANINRKIVGLIYNLCQRNGFRGLTEYDIDQAFPESKQSPDSLAKPMVDLQYKKNGNENFNRGKYKVKKAQKVLRNK